MKYTIEGFDQQTAFNYGLCLTDIFLLRWFIDFSSSGKMTHEIKDGNVFFWVCYQHAIDEFPILGIESRRVVARHFDKLVELGFLEKYVKRAGGTYTFYRALPKIVDLEYSKVQPGSTEKYTPVVLKSTDKDPSTKDSSLPKDSNTSTSLTLVEPKKAVDPLYKPTLDYLNQSLARILPDPKYEKADFVAVDWMAKKIIQLSPGNTEGFIDALLATWLELRRKKEFFGTQPLTPLALRKSHTWGTVIAEMSKTIQRSRPRAEV